MQVLLLNTYDLKGGAAKATWRLFKGLQEAGVRAQMLVQNKISKDQDVFEARGLFHNYFNCIRPYIDFAIPLPQTRKRILFSTNLLPDSVVDQINAINPDLVHLNWIAGGFIRIESLAKIKQPVIWTFHDIWAATGGCHYPLKCKKYQERCGCCPILHSTNENDLSRKSFFRKRDAYQSIKNLTIITPSRWLANCVSESALLGNRTVIVAPNGLDISVFHPSDKAIARDHFGFSHEKKLILFGAVRAAKNELKGFNRLLEALRQLDKSNLELIVFGSSNSEMVNDLDIPVRFLGYLPKESEIAMLYSAADVVAVPSFQEVFGQTASEALACGVPVVAFGATGLLDIVDHKKTGYLAKPFLSEDLATGIQWILEDAERYKELSENARRSAVERFDIKKTVGQVIGTYQEVLNHT
ncbi:MAG: glycosyltransferase family 4 protein [Bacteroidetes bacterium]|nr:glycosyltransferase family 4 protein [Bacteroidota bacterium]